jgi:chloramphenicol-sensitive protein RarD
MQEADQRQEQRVGTLAGLAAYSMWGLFPLVFHQLREVAAMEILLHRITWSFVVVVALLELRRDRTWLGVLRRASPNRHRLVLAALLISINWLVYVWAVTDGQVLQAALGYYINPLITVALGVVVLGEQLRRLQLLALVLGLASVVVLTVAYGQVPWISLVLACSFGGYGYLKKAVRVSAPTSLAVETAVLVPVAAVALSVLAVRGDGALGTGGLDRDALLLSLGAVTATPLLLFAASARRIPLTHLGLLQYLTPTVQFLCAVTILGEELPADRLVGFVLVWVALMVLALDAFDRNRRRRDPVLEPVELA